MTDHKVASREEWLAVREALLAREKEHTRMGDDLARQRRELPWVRVEKEYSFETDEGIRTLAELFDGRSQLLVYPSCSARATRRGARPAPLAPMPSTASFHISTPGTSRWFTFRARPWRSSWPISAGWAGASPGSHRPAASSTSTSGCHGPRNRRAKRSSR